MAAVVVNNAPRDRDLLDLERLSTRYTFQDLMDMEAGTRYDQRIEHRNLVMKTRIKEPFELPDNSKKSMLTQVDSHFGREQRMKTALQDLGLSETFIVFSIDVPYAAAVVADPANNVVAAAEVEETYHTDHHWFELDQQYTQNQVRAACRIFNRHPERRYTTANMLGIQVVLNNCKKELRSKIETQIEAVKNDQPMEIGGLLALYFLRRAVVQASQEYAETLVDDLKNFKVSDVAGENVDEAVRILRHTMAILQAANHLPQHMTKKILRIMQNTSVPAFNSIFDTWTNTAVITDTFPTTEEVLVRAVSVYTNLHSKGKWTPPSPRKSQMHQAEVKNDGTTPQTDSEAEKAKKQQRNRERRIRQKERKKARAEAEKKAAAAANGTRQETANVAAGLPSGSPGTERLRTFKIGEVELKGDVSPPLRAEQHIARTFKKTDGSGTMELWWCWSCGTGAGLWRPHQTYECPSNRRSAQGGGSGNQRVDFTESVGMLSGPEIQAPTVRGLT